MSASTIRILTVEASSIVFTPKRSVTPRSAWAPTERKNSYTPVTSCLKVRSQVISKWPFSHTGHLPQPSIHAPWEPISDLMRLFFKTPIYIQRTRSLVVLVVVIVLYLVLYPFVTYLWRAHFLFLPLFSYPFFNFLFCYFFCIIFCTLETFS